MRGGGGEGRLGAFRDERLSLVTFTCGGHGVDVDEGGMSDARGSFGRLTSMRVRLTNAWSAWGVLLETNRNAGKRR